MIIAKDVGDGVARAIRAYLEGELSGSMKVGGSYTIEVVMDREELIVLARVPSVLLEH